MRAVVACGLSALNCYIGSGLSVAELLGTFGTKPLYHIVDAVEHKTLGQAHHGNVYALKAECAVAVLTVEVSVLILNPAVAVVAAYVVFKAAASVVDNMYQTVHQKHRQRARYCAFVHRGQQFLQLGQRHSLVAPEHCAQYQQARGRGLYAPVLQFVYVKFFRCHSDAKIMLFVRKAKFSGYYFRLRPIYPLHACRRISL